MYIAVPDITIVFTPEFAFGLKLVSIIHVDVTLAIKFLVSHDIVVNAHHTMTLSSL